MVEVCVGCRPDSPLPSLRLRLLEKCVQGDDIVIAEMAGNHTGVVRDVRNVGYDMVDEGRRRSWVGWLPDQLVEAHVMQHGDVLLNAGFVTI